MNKHSKILFFGKKNCTFSRKVLYELKRNSKNIKCIYSKNPKAKLSKKILRWKGDYIICFRSYFILPNILIKKASVAAINFHPGPPNYRGIGCVNFAIFNSEKTYGSTCHLISKKVDFGKIIDVRRFKIKDKDNINSILKKTSNLQFDQLKKLIKKLRSNTNNLKYMIKKSKKEKWSKKLYTRRQLDDLYRINKGTKINITNLDNYLKSTVTEKFMPFIEIKKKKLFLSNKKNKL
jgi:methionyl-tRNA formyltransferase